MYKLSINELITSLTNNYKGKFQSSEILEMRKLAHNKDTFIPPNSRQTTLHEHIKHCVHQLIRIPYQAINNNDFPPNKIMQFGLNLGRLQELLSSYGGVDCWFRVFKPYFLSNPTKKELEILIQLGLELCNILEIGYPSQEFLDSK